MVQLDVLINLCGTTGFANKFVWYNGNPAQNLTRCAPSPKILDKTSQDAPYPRKSWTKRCLPSPEIPKKSRKNPGKNLTKRRFARWLLVGWFRQARQRPPARAMIVPRDAGIRRSTHARESTLKNNNMKTPDGNAMETQMAFENQGDAFMIIRNPI